MQVVIIRAAGKAPRFEAIAAIETSLEIDILEAGGMLPFILERCLNRTLRPEMMSASG